MKMLHTICYISNAKPELSNKEIENIFEETKNNNTDCKVSGILLYNLGHFFQVLEGEKEHIIDLYENKIKKDTRHEGIFEVYNKETAKPVFLQYNSKFNVVKTEKDLQKIKDYLNSVRTTTSNKLARLLRPFMMFEEVE